MERDQMMKIVIIGDSSVGKSNILSRYVSNEFGKCQSTIGCQSIIKKVDINGQKIKLMIWDTAGQQRYKSISQAYYRGAAAVILVYDVTQQQSFRNLTKWYEQLSIQLAYLVSNSQSSIIKVVVGNKIDLQANRVITSDQGEVFSRQRNIGFFQVSAATGANINDVFQYILKSKTFSNSEYVQKQGKQSVQLIPSHTIKLKPIVPKTQTKKSQSRMC